MSTTEDRPASGQEPQWSADGQWWWDGKRWLPVHQAPLRQLWTIAQWPVVKWLRGRLAEPAAGSSVIDASATQAGRSAFMLEIGLVLGTGCAVAGGVVGGLIDSGSRALGAITYGPILIVLPVIGYAFAIGFLRVGRARLKVQENISRDQLVGGRRSLTIARGAIIAGLIPNAFLALFGELTLIGAADAFDNGLAVSGAGGIVAEWLILIPAIMAMLWAGAAAKLTPALVSNDGMWWWDGVAWRPVPVGPGQSTQTVEARTRSDAPMAGDYRSGVVAYGPETNPLTVVSGIAGILSWTVCPVAAGLAAVVTGHIALRQVSKLHQSGRGWAFAGIVLGYLNLILFGGLAILVLLSTTGHLPSSMP